METGRVRRILGGIGVVTVAAIVAAGAKGRIAEGAEEEGMGSVAAPETAGAERAAGRTAQEIPPEQLPRFTADGKLLRPEGWETWVLAGTSMGLTYDEPAAAPAPGDPPGMFLNVYIQPWAYDHFMESAHFPEGTMFILSASRPVRKADPARGGFYQGDLRLLEIHLKREGIDPTGWAFYGFGGAAEAADKFPGEASCYECHAAEGDFDNVFVQFYPKIRERLGIEPAAEEE